MAQDPVCYCETCSLWEKTVGYEQASGTKPVNKVIVEGLFTEQSSSVQWAKRQRVLKSRSQKTRLIEGWVELSLVFLYSYQAESFYQHTFSNLDECSLYGSEKKLGR